ncbi:hypothetical protein [Ferrovum sp. PN-J185]|uniref:hypothetical protein n=1 Tax=Ferrovum sp. PN-J185 TaxID=1356306 RepID=UPI0007920677|nr:hypothetical protein [Ferrovum sp. PN-J185]KXW55450.1 hypothetical protein FV185_16970 [Ferrovum sp. PN-J185]
MPKISFKLLSIKPTSQMTSFRPLLLYLTRDYFKEEDWCLSQGLMGQRGFKATLNNKKDIFSMTYLLKGAFLLTANPHTLMVHGVISWQSSSTDYLSINKELTRFLNHHQSFYSQALWFTHTNTPHPHVHILLFSDHHQQQLLRSLKRDVKTHHQDNSDVRIFSKNDHNYEFIHTKPFTFYQWLRRYLKDQLVDYVDMPHSNWDQFQTILNYCHIQLIPQHQSFSWSTSLNGHVIHIKPSLIDKKLSSQYLLNKWGPYSPINTINTLSKLNYQHYYSCFEEHGTRALFHQNPLHDALSLAQLTQRYYYSNKSRLSFNSRTTNPLHHKTHYAIIERLSDLKLVSTREHQQLKKQLLTMHSSPLLVNKQVNKKISWLHFLINETYNNNVTAKTLLEDIWRNHEMQPKILSAFISSLNTAEQQINGLLKRSLKHNIEIER